MILAEKHSASHTCSIRKDKDHFLIFKLELASHN